LEWRLPDHSSRSITDINSLSHLNKKSPELLQGSFYFCLNMGLVSSIGSVRMGNKKLINTPKSDLPAVGRINIICFTESG